MVDPHHDLHRGLVDPPQAPAPARAHQRQQVGLDALDVIDLLRQQRIELHRWVGNGDHFQPLDPDDLAARCPDRRLGTGHVIGVAGEDHLLVGQRFPRHEAERAGADQLGDRLRRRQQRETSGHHGGHVRAELGQGFEHEGERLPQHDLKAVLVERRHACPWRRAAGRPSHRAPTSGGSTARNPRPSRAGRHASAARAAG